MCAWHLYLPKHPGKGCIPLRTYCSTHSAFRYTYIHLSCPLNKGVLKLKTSPWISTFSYSENKADQSWQTIYQFGLCYIVQHSSSLRNQQSLQFLQLYLHCSYMFLWSIQNLLLCLRLSLIWNHSPLISKRYKCGYWPLISQHSCKRLLNVTSFT